MPSKHTLIRGAFILTAAGFISRFMGFFFRIFLSHAFGEENVGLYQLIFPVYALCHSVSTAGIETALSRTVARKISLNRHQEAKSALFAALFFTVSLSLLEIILIQQNASFISGYFLGDSRCSELLIIISYALPCAAVHCCICGYSFGLQKTEVPAVSQPDQTVCPYCLCIPLFLLIRKSGSTPSISIAAAGIVAGEIFSLLYSWRFLSKTIRRPAGLSLLSIKRPAAELLRLSLPLTANRTAVTLLQSIEAASIPASLKLYGLNTADALSTYGVLTGMALPCILFPSAITSSVGTVLMPAVTKTQADGNASGTVSLIRKAAGSCFFSRYCLLSVLPDFRPFPWKSSVSQSCRRKIYSDTGLDLSVSLRKHSTYQFDKRAGKNRFYFSDQHIEPGHTNCQCISDYSPIWDYRISVGGCSQAREL